MVKRKSSGDFKTKNSINLNASVTHKRLFGGSKEPLVYQIQYWQYDDFQDNIEKKYYFSSIRFA